MTKLLLPAQILGEIGRHGRNWPRGRERGGLLLGHRKADAIQLTSATFPNAWDQGSPTRFCRSERGHRVSALRAWLKSGMTVDWVGEWHTHSGINAAPSLIDRRSWAQIAKHTGKTMAFLILSDQAAYVALQFAGDREPRRLREIERSSDASLFG